MQHALLCLAAVALVSCGGKVVFAEDGGAGGGVSTGSVAKAPSSTSHAGSSSTGVAEAHVIVIGHDPLTLVVSSLPLTCAFSPNVPAQCGWWQDRTVLPALDLAVGPLKSDVSRTFSFAGPQTNPADPLSCLITETGTVGHLTIDALDASSISVTLVGHNSESPALADGSYSGLRCP